MFKRDAFLKMKIGQHLDLDPIFPGLGTDPALAQLQKVSSNKDVFKFDLYAYGIALGTLTVKFPLRGDPQVVVS